MGIKHQQTHKHPPVALRYMSNVSWKCFVFFYLQVLWNGQYPPRGHRGIETKGCYSQSGWQDRRLQTPKPHHVCLGDPGQAPGREGVRQRQRPQRQLHQQVLHLRTLAKYRLVATGTDTDGFLTLDIFTCSCACVCVCAGKEKSGWGPGLHMHEVAAAQWFNTMVQWQPFPLSTEAEKREAWRNNREEGVSKRGGQRGRKVREKRGRQRAQKAEGRKRARQESLREERKKRGRDGGKEGLAWAAKQEVWGPSAMSAGLSHFTHTHTHTYSIWLPRWSCSRCRSSSLPLLLSLFAATPAHSHKHKRALHTH